MISIQKKEKKEVHSQYSGFVILDGPPIDFSNKKLKSLAGSRKMKRTR